MDIVKYGACLSKKSLIFFLMLPFLLVMTFHGTIYAEGQTKFRKEFFNNVEPIKVKDPLAVVLGAMDKTEVFTFTYADAIKFAGHSCPVVAGAYKSTQLALKKLYGDEYPVRGNIKVTVKGDVDQKVNGPISQIVTMITGAAPESGFKGLGPAGKYGRYNLMTFDGEQITNKKVTCVITFRRIDTAQTVEVTYLAAKAPMNEHTKKLMPLIISGKASDKERGDFGDLMQERVKTILLNPPEGTFIVREKG